MLVSHSHKFIYTKTSKTGGTSVEVYFERFCMPEGDWTFKDGRDEYISESGIIGFRGSSKDKHKKYKWWNHMPASLIKERIGEEIWASYFKFCVVRNPYEKAISHFYFFGQKNPPVQVNNLKNEQELFESWLQSSQPVINKDKYMIDEKFCLDDVIRYETLTTDLERICIQLNITWDPTLLPTLKKGIRPQNATVENLYTKKSRKLVESLYRFELDYFGYTFPSSNV